MTMTTAVLCSLLAAAPAPSAPPVRYLALGDSFTAGTALPKEESFPEQLAALLKRGGREVSLLNPAVAGFTTDDLIARELPLVADFKPTLITVAIGANDLVRQPGEDRYRQQVRRILKAVSGLGATVVVLPQPDWSVAPVAAQFGTPAQLRAQIERMNQILAEEAKARGARFLDLWAGNVRASQEGHFASDGLHPDATVYAAWSKAIAAAVTR